MDYKNLPLSFIAIITLPLTYIHSIYMCCVNCKDSNDVTSPTTHRHVLSHCHMCRQQNMCTAASK